MGAEKFDIGHEVEIKPFTGNTSNEVALLRFPSHCEASEAMQRAFRDATPEDWKRYWEAY